MDSYLPWIPSGGDLADVVWGPSLGILRPMTDLRLSDPMFTCSLVGFDILGYLDTLGKLVIRYKFELAPLVLSPVDVISEFIL